MNFTNFLEGIRFGIKDHTVARIPRVAARALLHIQDFFLPLSSSINQTFCHTFQQFEEILLSRKGLLEKLSTVQRSNESNLTREEPKTIARVGFVGGLTPLLHCIGT